METIAIIIVLGERKPCTRWSWKLLAGLSSSMSVPSRIQARKKCLSASRRALFAGPIFTSSTVNYPNPNSHSFPVTKSWDALNGRGRPSITSTAVNA